MIKKFETMFPRSLYVAKNTTYEEITNTFKLFSPTTEDEIEYNKDSFDKDVFDESIVATVFLVEEKETTNVGYLAILNEDKVDYGVCTHEATHVCKHMEDHFGLESDANEYRAYLTEWYSNRIAEVWEGKFDKDTNDGLPSCEK